MVIWYSVDYSSRVLCSPIVTRLSVIKHLFGGGTHHRRIAMIGCAPEQTVNTQNRTHKEHGPLEDTLLPNSTF